MNGYLFAQIIPSYKPPKRGREFEQLFWPRDLPRLILPFEPRLWVLAFVWVAQPGSTKRISLRHVDDSPHLSSVFTSHSRQRQHACESPTVARAPPDIGRPVFSIVGLQRMLERVSFRELGKRFCGCAWPKSPLFIPFQSFS